MEVQLHINGITYTAAKGETLLAVLNRHGIHVPTLCSMKGLSPSGACRMCVVELEGSDQLVPSCSFHVNQEIRIRTHSTRVLRARKTNVELLLASHPDDCLYCERNGSCELQGLAEELNIRERRIPGKKRQHQVDRSGPAIVRDNSKCILCGRCVRVCEEVMNTATFDFSRRGNRMQIATAMDRPLNFTNCTSCGQCVIACPTGALTEQVQWQRLHALIQSPDVYLAAMISPSSLASVGELLGRRAGSDQGRLIREILHRSGFDLVVDTSAGAELMMMEQSEVFLSRLREAGEWPLITSSCPAWVRYAEMYHQDLLPLLSPLKSPGQVMAGWIRNYCSEHVSGDRKVVCVEFTGCTAAKAEAVRPELAPGSARGLDLVLTTRELGRFIRLSGLDLDQLEKDLSGSHRLPGGEVEIMDPGGDGMLTAAAGGELEGTLRCIHHRWTGEEMLPFRPHRHKNHRSVMEWSLQMGGEDYKVASVSGLSNAAAYLAELKEGNRKAHMVEIMACPGGCINGGGQPVPGRDDCMKQRSRMVQEMAKSPGSGGAHNHPGIQKFYDDAAEQPGTDRSRSLFHTVFHPEGSR